MKYTNSKKTALYKFLSYFRPYSKILFFAVIFIIILSICEAAFPLIFKFVIDTILKGKGFKAILSITYIWSILFILWGISKYISDYLMLLLAHEFGYNLRKDLFNYLQGLTLGFFQAHPTGGLMANIINDIETIEDVLKNESRDLIVYSIVLFVCLWMMLFLDWRLFIISVIAFPAITTALRFLGLRFSEIARVIIDKRARINAYLQEIFSYIRIVKTHTQEEKEKLSFDKFSQEYLKIRFKDSKIKAVLDSTIGFVNNIGLLAVIYLGFTLVVKNRLSLGVLVAFIYYLGIIRGKVTGVIKSYIPLKQSLTVFSDLIKLKEEIPEENKAHPKPILSNIEGRIEFKSVWFGYSEQKEPILKDASFVINPKEKVALIGESGVGKTTLVNLMLRFYQPIKGKILIDGYDIKEVNLTSLRKQIAIVSQDDILFNTTIKENIAYGKEDATWAELIQASKIAKAHESIISLPQGYKTIVGEKGTRLSGGERQRISIARAILRNPKILILDEATSYLNDELEVLIYDALDYFIKDKIVFIITHRASTVTKIATKILFFDNGMIQELEPQEFIASPSAMLK